MAKPERGLSKEHSGFLVPIFLRKSQLAINTCLTVVYHLIQSLMNSTAPWYAGISGEGVDMAYIIHTAFALLCSLPLQNIA